MGIQRKKSLEEMRVQALNSGSDYLYQRYLIEVQARQRNKDKKDEFETYLKDEMAKYPLGCNPYQE